MLQWHSHVTLTAINTIQRYDEATIDKNWQQFVKHSVLPNIHGVIKEIKL